MNARKVSAALNRFRSAFSVTGVMTVAITLMPATNFAQPATTDSWVAPRTAHGHPDLQGVWSNNSATPLERPETLGAQDVLTDEELARLKARYAQIFATGAGDAAFGDRIFTTALGDEKEFEYSSSGLTATGNYNQFWLVDREFDHRTSLVVDPPTGRRPPLTPAVRRTLDARAKQWANNPASSYTDRRPQERCITVGMPNLFPGYNSYIQIVQAADYVVFMHEMMHDARIIPLGNAPHVDNAIRQWHGDARGHWDGDTLVVETTNFSAQAESPGAVTQRHKGSAEQLRLLERFTRIGPETIHHLFTVDDPGNYTASWTAMIPLRRSADAIYEYACHEGNSAMAGILAGQRAQEHRTADP